MLLTNGRVYTLGGGRGAADSAVNTLVVRGGRVVFAGRRGDVNPAPGEPAIDLEGRAVLPGLVNGHAHIFTCPEDRIKDIAPVLTMVAGEVAFSRDPLPGIDRGRS